MKKIIKPKCDRALIVNSADIVSTSLLNKQQGAVLIWSVVILMILTMVGISAVKMSGIGTQITGNSIFSMLVFQGAESSLGKTTKIYYIKEAIEKKPIKKIDVPALDLPDENASKGKLKSQVSVAWKSYQGCPISSSAYSSIQKCHYFDVEARTVLSGTGARANHILGVAKPGPATGVTWTN